MVSGHQEQDSNRPVMEIILHSAITAVLCVELDWADGVERHSLDIIPQAVPTSAGEVRRRHCFINANVRE